MLSRFVASLFASLTLLLFMGHAQATDSQYVRFNTTVGSVDVLMLSDEAPNTVTNFLSYLNSGAYNVSIFHRSLTVPIGGLGIVQGGGYEDKLATTSGETDFVPIHANAAINNEFNVSNTAGTLAMALVGGNANSATDQWFFNVIDNSASLDPQSFTVFGRVFSGDSSSQNVLTALNTIPIFNASSAFKTGGSDDGNFSDMPLIDYTAGVALRTSNYVEVISIVNESQPTTGTVTLSKSTVTVPYTGKPAAAWTATTNPPKLKTVISYGGELVPPTATGTYTVLGDITAPGFSGSATGTIVITPAPPIITTGVASAISATGANLGISVDPKTVDTTVFLEYGPSAGTYTTGTTTSVDVGSGSTTESGALPTTGTLTPSTLYHFRAVATTATGTFTGEDKTFTTLVEPVFGSGPAAAPLRSATGAQVSFTVNPNGVATSVFFKYSLNSDMSDASSTVVQNIGAGKVPVTVTGFLGDLEPGETYYYEVVTESAAGSFTSSIASFTTLGFDTSIVAATTGTATFPAGAKYNALGAAAINSTDGVAFYSTLVLNSSNPTITAANDAGIWANQGTSTLTLIAQTGTANVPGVTGATFLALGNPVFNEASNDVAFEGTLKVGAGGVTTKNDMGVWATDHGTLQLVAREGDPAPSGTTFSTFTAIAEADADSTDPLTIVVSTMALGTGVTASNNTGIWEGTQESNLALKLRTGDVVGGKQIATLTLNSTLPLVQGQTRNFASANGDLALLGTFTDKTTGIVTSIGGTPALAYKVGDMPSGAGGLAFAKFSSPVINNNDHVAFEATLATGGAVTAANSASIWAGNVTGSLNLIARTGEAPNNFLTLSDPLYNNNDVVAFSATYKSGTKVLTGLFDTSTGSAALVAQTGDPAPGCASGATFSTFKAMALPDAGGINSGTGGLVFGATIAGTGVTTGNNTGIWIVDNTGTKQLVVRTGDNFNVSTTSTPSFKTVTALAFLPFTATLDGQTRSMAKNGDLTYTATFSDKTTAVFSVQFP